MIFTSLPTTSQAWNKLRWDGPSDRTPSSEHVEEPGLEMTHELLLDEASKL